MVNETAREMAPPGRSVCTHIYLKFRPVLNADLIPIMPPKRAWKTALGAKVISYCYVGS